MIACYNIEFDCFRSHVTFEIVNMSNLFSGIRNSSKTEEKLGGGGGGGRGEGSGRKTFPQINPIHSLVLLCAWSLSSNDRVAHNPCSTKNIVPFDTLCKVSPYF